MKLLLENIKELVQVEDNPVAFCAGSEMATVKIIKDAFLIIQDELIQDFGPMSQLMDVYKDDDFLIEIDCSDRLVYPCYCDARRNLSIAFAAFPTKKLPVVGEEFSTRQNCCMKHLTRNCTTMPCIGFLK